jgi:uncharacterized protein (UPF0276 family)
MHQARPQYPVQGAGLGLRRPLAEKLKDVPQGAIDFMEVAPENWIHVGGAMGKTLRYFTERYPFLIHGLSLSIGAPAPLDEQLVRDIKGFMATHNIRLYSEHLSYCGDDGHLESKALMFCEPGSTAQPTKVSFGAFSTSFPSFFHH